ncbi:MAG: hypothetical protein BWK73_49235 [Thiothrix lacustris]|uniref:Uncharacterized protein n=1 Tax=Thiothrix lacustris TaxID=525917 RepID=A0A1Y1Q8Z8_9GAMM|nr:MAG: hypothetical protein BWK73_49235 [Thiothrix lacustris]
MQHQRIPMTFDEYDLLEQPFGYKVEYWDGYTVITPRDNLREHADTSIKRYFAGKRGEPHPASVMALAEDGSISGIVADRR